LKHTLIYVKKTIDYRIIYKGGETLNPINYIDLDYASYKNTRCSTKGNIFIIANGPVSWKSKYQEIMVLFMV